MAQVVNQRSPLPDLIGQRLSNPRFVVGLEQLSQRYFRQTIVLRTRSSHLARDEKCKFTIKDISKLRGAWGNALLRGASENARQNLACNWQPECGLFALFQSHGELEKGRVFHKPYDIGFGHTPHNDVQLRVTLHGFACDWVDEAAASLVNGLRNGLGNPSVPWHVLDRGIETHEQVTRLPDANRYLIELQTPLALRQGGSLDQDVRSLLVSFAQRARNMARWQDSELIFPDGFLDELHAARISRVQGEKTGWRRKSYRQEGKLIPVEGVTGTIEVANITPAIRKLLSFAPVLQIGARASIGFGRIQIVAVKD